MRIAKKSQFIAVALICGCSSDADVVKEGRLQGLPEYTVSQALDNRDICRSTSWSSFQDDKERNIVRYRCEMKGVKDLYYDMAQNLILKGETKESQKQLEARIAETREKVYKNEEKIKDNIEKIEKEIPDKEQKIHEEMARQQGDSGSSTASSGLLDQRLALRRTRKDLEIENYNLNRSISHLKEEVARMELRLEEEKAAADEDLQLGHYIMENHENTAAYEIIDWLVIDEKEFIVLGGSLFEKGVGETEFQEVIHPDVEAAIAVIYGDEVQDYFDYRNALGY